MKMNVIERKKGKLKLEVDSELAFLNLLNEYLWKQPDIKVAAFTRKHPYVATPELLVKSPNPKKSLLTAVKKIKVDLSSVKRQIGHEFGS
ncbi:MAG: hypothetical protein B6U68_03130 [Candidatus Aenigmarchaeota archaeon ex4484_14]|nr:MAG: hypothetical protein B6U68_03130 [Candidatus Aenigmarchaeota archaeon ex4484_14]